MWTILHRYGDNIAQHCLDCMCNFEDSHCKIEFNTLFSFQTRQNGSVKKLNHQNQISEQMGHARGVGYVQKSRNLEIQKNNIVIHAIRAQPPISSIFGPIYMKFGSIPKIEFLDHLIFYFFSVRRSIDDFTTPGGRKGGSKPGNGWSN